MIEVKLFEACKNLSRLLDMVERGEEVRILRRGHAPVRVVRDPAEKPQMPDLKAFRESLRVPGAISENSVLEGRREERY